MAKVFLTSCETGEGAWRTHERKLKRLYQMSDRRHILVNDAEKADLIIVGNVREENWGSSIRGNQLIAAFPRKSCSLSDQDHPLILHHGVYASGTKSLLSIDRVRTGSYTLYSDKFLNPFVAETDPNKGERMTKRFLMSFVGRCSHPVRTVLFNLRFARDDIYVENTDEFKLWAEIGDSFDRSRQQRRYVDLMLQSKFALCPRGNGAGTMRLFEAMALSIPPVVISDDYLLPRGPDWKAFSIRVKERHIRDIESIVEAHESSFREMGRIARDEYQRLFAEENYFNYLVETCLELVEEQYIPETWFWRCRNLVALAVRIRQTLRVRTRVKSFLSH